VYLQVKYIARGGGGEYSRRCQDVLDPLSPLFLYRNTPAYTPAPAARVYLQVKYIARGGGGEGSTIAGVKVVGPSSLLFLYRNTPAYTPTPAASVYLQWGRGQYSRKYQVA
jgi:hypothetical protein